MDVLTEKQIAGLEPRTATDYTDAGQAGLTLRVSAGGAVKTWTWLYRFNGKRGRLNLGRYPGVNLAAARKAARDAGHLLDDGKDPGKVSAAVVAARPDRTFRALVDRFEHAKRRSGKPIKPATLAEMLRILRVDALPTLGDRDVDTITRAELRALHAAKSATAPVLADRLLSHISRVFTFAIVDLELEEWIEANPAGKIDKNGSEPRVRFLKAGELAIVAAALTAPIVAATSSKRVALTASRRAVMHAAFWFLLLTGQRLKEVMRAKWDEVDLVAAVWTIPGARTKNGRPHTVPLGPLGFALVSALRAARPAVIPASAPFVFSTTDGITSIAARAKKFCSQIFGPALVEAFGAEGVAAFGAHDFRRTMTTYAGALGIDEATLGRLLNHTAVDAKKESTTRRHYNMYRYDREKRAAFVAWETRIAELVAGVPCAGAWAIRPAAVFVRGERTARPTLPRRALPAAAGRRDVAALELEAPALEAELVAS